MYFSNRSRHHKGGSPDRKSASAVFLLMAIKHIDIFMLWHLLNNLVSFRWKGQTAVGISLKWRKKQMSSNYSQLKNPFRYTLKPQSASKPHEL